MNQDKAPWEAFISPEKLPVMPKGYMTAFQISKKTGKTFRQIEYILQKARVDGVVDCIKGISEFGRPCWFYKTKGEADEPISDKNNRHKNNKKIKRRVRTKTPLKAKKVSFL